MEALHRLNRTTRMSLWALIRQLRLLLQRLRQLSSKLVPNRRRLRVRRSVKSVNIRERSERRRSKSWRRKRPCTLVRIQKTVRRSKSPSRHMETISLSLVLAMLFLRTSE